MVHVNKLPNSIRLWNLQSLQRLCGPMLSEAWYSVYFEPKCYFTLHISFLLILFLLPRRCVSNILTCFCGSLSTQIFLLLNLAQTLRGKQFFAAVISAQKTHFVDGSPTHYNHYNHTEVPRHLPHLANLPRHPRPRNVPDHILLRKRWADEIDIAQITKSRLALTPSFEASWNCLSLKHEQDCEMGGWNRRCANGRNRLFSFFTDCFNSKK